MRKVFLFLLAAAAWALCLPARELLEIKGDYLLYSYDFNYIYGQGNIRITAKDWVIQAGVVEIDVAGRIALVSRDCRVEAGKKQYVADTLEIDLESFDLKFTTFKENIQSWTLARGREGDVGPGGLKKKFAARDPEGLKKSLVYFLNRRIVITDIYRVFGYQTTVFIEGVQSLSFKKFKLDQGSDTTQVQGAVIDKIWYYSSQGLVVNSRFMLEKPVKKGTAKSANVLDVKYDLFGRVETGSALRVNFNSQNSFSLTRKNDARLNINFLTANLFSTRFAIMSQWTPKWNSEMAAEYSRTAAGREELWLRLDSDLRSKVPGNLRLNLGYEKEKQYQAEISLQNQSLKNFSLSLKHSRSRLMYGEDSYNRLSSSAFSLAYTNRLFNLAADYSFHRDLLQDLSQGTPRFTLNATPFRLYYGLLNVNFSSSFMVNQLILAGQHSDESRANLALSLRSETIRLGQGPAVTLALSAEQLLEPERSDQFTSLGCVLKCSQSIFAFADIDFMYNYNTRRQTEAWLIQGSTSQDWSTILRLKENSERLKGWVSFSYDTKTGHFTNSYLDCAVALIKNWQFQTQMNYDFLFKNFNYDVYLIRYAGRIMLRASYRSLSRKFLLEVLPR